MRLDVAFTPSMLVDPERKVAVVIDVLRATSSLVTMFAGGLEEALVAGTVEEGRALAAGRPGYLLCGERGGLPPEGFDHGNSPVEFTAADLRGRRAVIATTNGTSAFAEAASCRTVFAGALLNVEAVARAARDAAAGDLDVVLVCAGNGRGRLFALEDAFCAGAVVDAFERMAAVEMWSSATAALRLYRSYNGAAEDALRESDHARGLEALGLEDDVVFCGRRDVYDAVPRLGRGEDGVLRLTARA